LPIFFRAAVVIGFIVLEATRFILGITFVSY